MIDDEKIKEAIEDYIRYSSVEDEYPGTEGEAFRAGANWAINEFLKDLWHPASEIPTKPNASILAKAIYDTEEDTLLKYPFYYTTYTPPCDMYSKNPSEVWNKANSNLGTSDWLYIDDLLPKKGGNHD